MEDESVRGNYIKGGMPESKGSPMGRIWGEIIELYRELAGSSAAVN